MPRRRRTPFTKRFLNTARDAGRVASVAFTALKVATSVAALINTEFKFVDTNVSAAALATPATTAFITNLTAMQQGTDEQNRVGNSILPKGLNIRLEFSGNPSGGAIQEIRYVIIIDRDQDGADPTIVQLLQTATLLDSFLNMDNKKRFRVLVDRKFHVGNSSTASHIKRNVSRSHYLKFNKPQRLRAHNHVKRKWYHVLYSGTSAAETDQDNGAIYILAWSNEVTNSPTCRITARLRYIDN